MYLSNSISHITVIRNGRLTARIRCCIEEAKTAGVNVGAVLQQEKERCSTQLVKNMLFGEPGPTCYKESSTLLRAKVRACNEILDALNS